MIDSAQNIYEIVGSVRRWIFVNEMYYSSRSVTNLSNGRFSMS